MSRRNRDYSLADPVGRYHSYHNAELGGCAEAAIKVAGALVSLGAIIGFNACDDWATYRDDLKEYNDESRQTAVDYMTDVMQQGHVLVVTLASDTGQVHEVPTVPEGDLEERFEDSLANAMAQGGQPHDEVSFDPYRFDLRWRGYPGKYRRNVPDKHCETLTLPEETVALVSWQADDERATLKVLSSNQGERVQIDVCQYGDDQTDKHHDVAVDAIRPGER